MQAKTRNSAAYEILLADSVYRSTRNSRELFFDNYNCKQSNFLTVYKCELIILLDYINMLEISKNEKMLLTNEIGLNKLFVDEFRFMDIVNLFHFLLYRCVKQPYNSVNVRANRYHILISKNEKQSFYSIELCLLNMSICLRFRVKAKQILIINNSVYCLLDREKRLLVQDYVYRTYVYE